MPLSQTDRAGKLTTPLGEDVLTFSHLDGGEGLSELFEFHVEAVSEQPNIDFSSTLGQGATVVFQAADGLKRYFNGIMTEAKWAGVRHDLSVYRFVLRPWLWLLTRTSDCRIFRQMTPTDIVKKVFSDRGFSDFRDATTGSPPTLEYCVQYRETDFNFVCRLMEEYGVYYFFEHEDDKHTLVLADAKASHKPTPGLSSLPYNPIQRGGRREIQYLESWLLSRRAQSGKFSLEDYGYKKPSANLLAQAENPGGYAHDSMEMFDYTYSYVDTEGNNLIDKDVGDKLAKFRLEAAQSLDMRRNSTGAAPSLSPGALVTLKEHPNDGENREYLIAHCTHFIESESYRSGGGGDSGAYTGNYQMTPSDRQFRAPFVTPKPKIPGYQSALVIRDKQNAGEEIDVDELGRILVFFYWDRERKHARRIRVAQIWAGSNRGGLFTPRVGDEVLVAYEEGDPDRPIVIGSVYNGTNTVPLTLPDKKVKSGILTLSSKGGGGYNMLLFDDTAGSENVKLRTQKDLKFKALNDQMISIGQDRTDQVGNNINQTVGNNHTINVSTNYTLTAGQQILLQVGSSTITMTPSSITIQSPQISLIADAQVSISAPDVSITE
jgi:type VI secretion system secreted protein VgrG